MKLPLDLADRAIIKVLALIKEAVSIWFPHDLQGLPLTFDAFLCVGSAVPLT
jgi:hypothetical protein